VVNNAGVTSPIPFLEVTAQEWERMFAVNVRGSYNVTRQLAPGMVERGFGRIVFLSSVSAERGGGVLRRGRLLRGQGRSARVRPRAGP
jgi:2-hydroxycyclohexanecarboxyl-CoA dehydrogenase